MAAASASRAILGWIYRQDLAALKALTAHEANLPDSGGFTPLMNAVLATPPSAEIVQTLIERGADVNATDKKQLWTALHFAARDCGAHIVQLLLDAGAKIDPQNAHGNTPLQENIMSSGGERRLLVARLLVSAGADVTLKNKHDVSPLDLANTIRDAEMLAVFAKQPGPIGTWERLLEGKTDADFVPYSVSHRYERGQLVQHAKFGKGAVVEVTPTNAQIVFRDGPKKLGHGL